MKTHLSLTVSERSHGDRLDQALDLLMPGLSRRQRQDLWQEYLVQVDGRAQAKGFRVSSGQQIVLTRNRQREAVKFRREDWPAVRIVKKQDDYAALFKPPGLHTVSLQRSLEPSLDQGLPLFFTEQSPQLLNRLDQITSGLVLAALSPEAVKHYRNFQLEGQVLKSYLAVCRGRIAQEMSIAQRIETSGGKKVRVRRDQDSNTLHHTRIASMDFDEGQGLSLVRALIFKGVRHQIRAHLAWLGHPLAGDPLYDPQANCAPWLQHHRIHFPGFECALRTMDSLT